jgi:DNA helicase II / ATP-dependent DNA helicase PcrA
MMVSDVIEVSFTGDILAHRRCPRSWVFEKHSGFQPYEQVQAMEGRLIHHAMEWMARRYREVRRHATAEELKQQIQRHFRVLWARGIRTAFTSKQETVERVLGNIFPGGKIHPTVKAAIEGAVHSEYELRTVKKLVREDFHGKSRLLLTGILDLVVQEEAPLIYPRTWRWSDAGALEGESAAIVAHADVGDIEIWDYKGSRASTKYLADYILQMLTYAALYQEKTGTLVKRCVLFFINEPDRAKQLLAVQVDQEVVDQALAWAKEQVRLLRQTALDFRDGPTNIQGGALELRLKPVGRRVVGDLRQQCTACGFRFDCEEYVAYVGGADKPDVSRSNIDKN